MVLKQMKGVSTLAVVAVVIVLALGYLGFGAYQKSQARAEQTRAVVAANERMDKAAKQWADAMELAGSAPRIGLAGPVATLQAIRQDVRGLAVPACLEKNRDHLVAGMNSGIEGILTFMRNDLPKYELDDFVVGKRKAMGESFALFQEKASGCPGV